LRSLPRRRTAMTARDVAVWALLAAGVGVEAACTAGLLRARDVLDRLHFTAAGAVAGPPLIAAAVVVQGTSTQAAVNASLVAVILALLGPLLTIATARAAQRDRLERDDS